jgi:alkylhydroperoxidase/carboxymuconolactone decarboxylase family protein YurZ
LTRLALNDDALLMDMTESEEKNLAVSGLDPRSHALVRLGAVLALGGSPASYASIVRLAEGTGASPDELVGVLVAVAPYIGIARTVSAAPDLALAVGFDVDDIIERGLDRPGGIGAPLETE